MDIGRLGLLRPDITSSRSVTGLAAGELSARIYSTSQNQPFDDAVTVTLSSGTFIGRLEKHIDDVKKGSGNLSSDVAEEVRQKAQEASESLASRDPKSLELYSRFIGTLTYDKKARYIHAIETAEEALELINETPVPGVAELSLKETAETTTGNSAGGEDRRALQQQAAAV